MSQILPDFACVLGVRWYDPGPTWAGVLLLPMVEQVTLGARPYMLID